MPLPDTAQAWLALAMWVLATAGVWCAAVSTADYFRQHAVWSYVRELHARLDEDVDNLHRRLDNANLPGVYVPPREETETVTIDMTPGTALLPVINPAKPVNPSPDRPEPWQTGEPTRPDFARMRAVPREPSVPPLEFVQPGERGRHRAPEDVA